MDRFKRMSKSDLLTQKYIQDLLNEKNKSQNYTYITTHFNAKRKHYEFTSISLYLSIYVYIYEINRKIFNKRHQKC